MEQLHDDYRNISVCAENQPFTLQQYFAFFVQF
jgi:hypothetical protein